MIFVRGILMQLWCILNKFVLWIQQRSWSAKLLEAVALWQLFFDSSTFQLLFAVVMWTWRGGYRWNQCYTKRWRLFLLFWKEVSNCSFYQQSFLTLLLCEKATNTSLIHSSLAALKCSTYDMESVVPEKEFVDIINTRNQKAEHDAFYLACCGYYSLKATTIFGVSM